MQYDRWSVLREIDEARDRIENKLRNGELVISFAGAILALIVGNFFNVFYGGFVLTVVVLMFSLLVVLRIAIIDVLCYQSEYVENEDIEHLKRMMWWNRGPINQTGAVAIAFFSIFFEYDSRGYRWGMDLIDDYGADDKWKNSDLYVSR